MRNGDVLRDIRNHLDAILDVLVQQIGTQLRIENAAGKKTSVRIRRIGTKAMNRYATIRRLRRLQSSRLLHQPMKRTRR